MSVRLYKYEEWKCEGEYCPNDCDRCYKADLTKEDLEEREEDERDRSRRLHHQR